MRIGIVGAGWAAIEHGATLARLDGVTVVGVADPDLTRAADLADSLGAVPHSSASALIASGELDAIVVASPPGAHREAAVQAFEAGLAVFLEKPIARTLQDAAAIVTACHASGAVCAVGYQWRSLTALAPLTEALAGNSPRHLVSEGIGITQARRWFGDPTLSGGLVAERGSHHIDLQRAVGGEVVAVQAVESRLGFAELGAPASLSAATGTGVVLTLRFMSGAVGIVHVLWVPEGYPSSHRLTVFGTTSVLDLELDPVFSLRRDGGEAVFADPTGEHPFAAGLIRFVEAATPTHARRRCLLSPRGSTHAGGSRRLREGDRQRWHDPGRSARGALMIAGSRILVTGAASGIGRCGGRGPRRQGRVGGGARPQRRSAANTRRRAAVRRRHGTRVSTRT